MLSFENAPDTTSDTVAPTPDADGTAPEDRSPTSAARVLELAAVTAEKLVADARSEAESLAAAAHESLERERTAALAGLADERAALEAQIASLRQLQTNHRSQMQQHLTKQLSLLDAVMPEPPASVSL
jgi:cell division septum initiation protein DivIVA